MPLGNTPLAGRDFLRRLRQDERGVFAIIIALTLPVILGFVAFGVEMGLWYLTARSLQTAADAGAYAGALEIRKGSDTATIQAAALQEAQRNGYNPAAPGASFVANRPPVNGPSSGSNQAVEVILSEDQNLLFASLLMGNTLSIPARAVAFVEIDSEACVLALSDSANGAVTVAGTADIVLTGCSIMSNSNSASAVDMIGNATMETDCVSAVGDIDDNGNIVLNGCSAVRPHTPPVPDPYADVDIDDLPAACDYSGTTSYNSNGVFTLSPGRYCGNLILQKGTLTLDPGTYYIDGGDFSISAQAEVQGTDVTIIFTNQPGGGGSDPTVTINGGATIDLSAPSGGNYPGMLFYYDRDISAGTVTVNGNSSTDMTGALYFPSQNVRFTGNNSAGSGCTHIIGNTVEFRGTASMVNNCGAAGTSVINVPGLGRLSE